MKWRCTDEGRFDQRLSRIVAKLTKYREIRTTPTRCAGARGQAAQRLGRNFQMMASLNKQWPHMAGRWNPTDPARFIQPDHFVNDKAIDMPRATTSTTAVELK